MAKPKPATYLIGGLLYTLLFAGSGSEIIGGSDSDNKCGGEERWKQKVLVDKESVEINESIHDTTIAGLLHLDTKKKENKYEEDKPRMPIEKQEYRIKHCFITKVMRENDNDLHLVIEDGEKHSMIAEIPDPKCPDAKKSPWIEFFDDARNTMLEYRNTYRHHLFTITGITFVDRSHGQTGKAPNNVEIHPVLEIKEEKKINPILQ